MPRAVLRMFLCALVAISASIAPAFAQGTAASLSGVVTDTAGGVVPGATVVVKNIATSVSSETMTSSAGAFSVPAIEPGMYSVTVSLGGFKTAVISGIRVVTGTPASITVKLEIGALTETVEVKGGSTLVQTTSSAVTSTISVEHLNKIPLNSRNALYSVALLPGVSTAGGPRGATINGLPNNTVNITIDGVSTGNMLQSGDGFFSMITPRMDAVEEITVTGAVPGSGGGAGSVQIQMTTRAGSNRFDGSVYQYYRGPDLNSNYYFNKVNNLPKNQVTAQQYGFRQGGPVVIPGLFNGRGKAFFFFNFERLYQPSSATRTRDLLRPEAQTGVFGYVSTVGGEQVRRQVNLVSLAQANGQISAFDPLVQKLLSEIRTATGTIGTINDTNAGNVLQYVYQSEAEGNQYSPTTRLDFNLSDRHRLSGAYWFQRFTSTADLLNNVDARFPGLPNFGTQNSFRTTGNSTLRSTFGSNMVNELKGGFQWSPNDFFSNVTAEQFANQDGLGISFPISSSPTVVITPQPRNTTTWSVDNTLNWLKGAHSLSMGGGYAGIFNRQNAYTVVPNVILGFDQNLDPAAPMFNLTNFPGATAAQLGEARNLYALLTGRVSNIAGTARLDAATGKYVYNGDLARKSRQSSFSAFVQDSWRVTPALTVNGGLRWDLHLPFTPADNTWSLATLEDICGMSGVGTGPGGRPCNIFNPSAQSGQLVPTFDRFEAGRPAHQTNWTDFAPNLGVAWRPNVQGGWLRTLLGDPDQATLRGGYAISYNQERIDRFTANAGSNAGGSIAAARDNGTGFPLVLPGETHPVLLSQRNRLGPPPFPESPVYPIAAAVGNSVNIFPDGRLRTPRVHSYSLGIQRSIGRDMALEVRYVGNRNKFTWAEENWNEANFLTNGFIEEFRAAQANIGANIAAGLGNRGFAYTGAPGTAPLPIHLAYLNGSASAGNPAAYTSTNFTSQAFINRFSPLLPSPVGAVGALHGTATFRSNAVRAGLPENLIVLNPRALGGTFVVQDKNWTQYNSLQVDLRRRLSQGLLLGANYTYGLRRGSLLETLHRDRIEVDRSDTSVTPRIVPHTFKMNWHYEVPVGRGRRFGGNMHPVLDVILGNWEYSGNARVQSERYKMIGVKLEGMTVAELQKAFKIRITQNPTTGRTEVFSFPQDIVDNTWAAFSVDPTTATGYSLARGVPTGRYIRPASDASCMALYRFDCNATDIELRGPLFSRWDMRLTKRFPFGNRVNLELTAEVLNVFDNVNFNHSANVNGGENTFRVTSAYTDINTTFDPGGRIGQLVWRINW